MSDEPRTPEPLRIDYDAVAWRYDRERLRGKQVDLDLVSWIADRAGDAACRVLDVGCGTGSQLVADQPALPGALLVGLDRSAGMLRQASFKSSAICWVHGDGVRLPFVSACFDYVTSQFSLHHVRAKQELMADVLRVLRPGGRFVITNLAPRLMRGWAVYRYFPQSWELDLADFWSPDEIERGLQRAGFDAVSVELDHAYPADELRSFAQAARLRVTSQLVAISEADYAAGMARLEQELAQAPDGPIPVSSELCLIKAIGCRPGAVL